MIVVDASALASALAVDSPVGMRAVRRLAVDPDQRAPELIDLEVVSMIRRWLGRGQLDGPRAARILVQLAALPLVRYAHLPGLTRVWELRHNVTPYDAAYVALAEALGATLLTADARLAHVPGIRCPVELVA